MTPRWSPLPGDKPDPRPVADSLDRVVSSLGVPRASTLSQVFASWEELVGDTVAAHARPRSLRAGVLVVAVEDPAWATQLKWLEGDLVGRLNEALGEGQIERVEVRVQPR